MNRFFFFRFSIQLTPKCDDFISIEHSQVGHISVSSRLQPETALRSFPPLQGRHTRRLPGHPELLRALPVHCSLHCSLVCPSYSHHLSPLLSPPSTHHAPTPTLASPPIPKRKLSNGHDRRMDQAIHFRIAAVLIATTTIIALLLFTMNRSKFMGDCREEPSRADGDGDA